MGVRLMPRSLGSRSSASRCPGANRPERTRAFRRVYAYSRAGVGSGPEGPIASHGLQRGWLRARCAAGPVRCCSRSPGEATADGVDAGRKLTTDSET